MTAATTAPATATVLGRLLASLQEACVFNRNDQVPPAVLLWTDAERQWEPLLPRLRRLLPHLLTLGPHDPAARTGPAIWLRCVLARTLPGLPAAPADLTPILYLPGVSRADLRAVEECPPALQPLAALQYLGVFWSHTNGKDWTVAAFLQSERGGLGLDLARDAATLEAVRAALPELLDQNVSALAGKPLSAEDFQTLLVPDPVRQVLRWLDDPAGARAPGTGRSGRPSAPSARSSTLSIRNWTANWRRRRSWAAGTRSGRTSGSGSRSRPRCIRGFPTVCERRVRRAACSMRRKAGRRTTSARSPPCAAICWRWRQRPPPRWQAGWRNWNAGTAAGAAGCGRGWAARAWRRWRIVWRWPGRREHRSMAPTSRRWRRPTPRAAGRPTPPCWTPWRRYGRARIRRRCGRRCWPLISRGCATWPNGSSNWRWGSSGDPRCAAGGAHRPGCVRAVRRRAAL